MSVSHINSIKKIAGYFEAVTKSPFTSNGAVIMPKPLEVSDSLASGYVCPDSCGACCQKFTLDYIDGEETPEGVRERSVEFNGKQVRVWTDLQRENRSDRCQHLSTIGGRCLIHSVRPFTCDFELIRVYMGNIRNYNKIGIGEFGRSWKLLRVSGEKGALCQITKPTEASIADTIRKLERLRRWAEHFGVVETWIPEIVEYLRGGQWRNGPLVLGNNERLYKQPLKHPGRELLKELISAGKHTRKELMGALMAAHPQVPKAAFATLLTDTKNPSMKYSPFDRRVEIGPKGVWSFEE